MVESEMITLLDAAMQQLVEYEKAWWTQSRRGRWVVLEPLPGRLLKNEPQAIRDRVDAVCSQRGRRFSSLSRARSFARKIGGEVRRWRRQMPGRGPWQHVTNPWERAVKPLQLWGRGARAA